MRDTTITQDRVDRVVTVHVKKVAKRLSSKSDAEVAGVYHIEIKKGVPKKNWAGVALDVFHSNVAVKSLDDFEFTVKDGQEEIIEPDDYESYSGGDKGELL